MHHVAPGEDDLYCVIVENDFKLCDLHARVQTINKSDYKQVRLWCSQTVMKLTSMGVTRNVDSHAFDFRIINCHDLHGVLEYYPTCCKLSNLVCCQCRHCNRPVIDHSFLEKWLKQAVNYIFMIWFFFAMKCVAEGLKERKSEGKVRCANQSANMYVSFWHCAQLLQC